MPITIVAIDGPAGAGKSTVSKLLASELQANLLDTGAFYRTITLALISNNIELDEVDDKILSSFQISQTFNRGKTTMYLDGQDVSDLIRGSEISQLTSVFSTNSIIRAHAVNLQREFIRNSISNQQSVVIEGRDIASVVAPEADVKIFLTASAEIRALRRSQEIGADVEATLRSLTERDNLDSSREISPLSKTDDSIEIDASNKTPEEVVDLILGLIAVRNRGEM